ncbi:DUF6496 domain-containing protein [Rhizosphaericola mali]|uniref:Uncharacterized protein n=1 Tax=Rhizosphaericola mali TaxID=2545455 RepID=A0A5P2G6W8_9BACT|nr:DUF6496 domain-containing protein [Rhizosphaericola mali]QES88973.1 hypothetical protein E0W69_009995 [Rhizosphaericola mali]
MAKYTDKSAEKVEDALHKMHKGKLKIRKSKKIVKSSQQAIAIGLSQADKLTKPSKNSKKQS